MDAYTRACYGAWEGSVKSNNLAWIFNPTNAKMWQKINIKVENHVDET